MNDKLKAFKIWAPEDVEWAQWAKPVLFSKYPYHVRDVVKVAKIDWIDSVVKDTMIIVDLEGSGGVREGLAYAQMGYRPVPLYNGVQGEYSQPVIIKVDEIQNALFAGTETLASYTISPKAPPVFLLDSRRMTNDKRRGVFDNRWSVFPQDMPSATYLMQRGITKVVVRTEKILDDLSHILYRYQKEGISIYQCYKDESPKKITVRRPSRFKSLRYRFLVTLGLRRNSTGGFGSYVPETSQYNSGSGYRGIG